MGREAAYYDASFEAFKDIRRLVAARIRLGARVEVGCQVGPPDAHSPSLHYICFTANKGPNDQYTVTNEPGIPREALVPEKIGPIAYWIVKQVSAKHPEWFVKDDITGL
jgi:hypothetical protein